MASILAVFALWGLWTTLASRITAPTWAWAAFVAVLGIGAQALLDRDTWYLGLGLGGAAIFLMQLSDLLLVTTDWIRVQVLRNQSRR